MIAIFLHLAFSRLVTLVYGLIYELQTRTSSNPLPYLSFKL